MAQVFVLEWVRGISQILRRIGFFLTRTKFASFLELVETLWGRAGVARPLESVLQNRLDRSRKRYGAVLAAAFGVVCASPEALAEEPEQRFRFYGHFSPMILTADDGVSRATNLADSSSSGGRVGVRFAQALDGQTTLKGNFEVSLGLRQSAAISQLYTPAMFDWSSHSVRKAEAIIESERWGRLSLGQGSMGSDGVAETDLSGTSLANYVGISDIAGGYFFRTASGTLSSVRITDVFPTFDGGRSVRLRWDSPEIRFGVLGGLRFAVSIGKEDFQRNVTLNDALQDAGLFYRNQIGNVTLAGSFGVSNVDDGTGGTAGQAAGSFSLLHGPSGLNATFATGSRDGFGHYGYMKLGVRRDYFGIGDTAFSVDYYESFDTAATGGRGQSYGIGVVQTLDKQDLELFLGYRLHSYLGGGLVKHRDIKTVSFGLRWKFRKLQQHRSILEELWQG